MEGIESWMITQHSKFFLTISDPGAISVPGVLKDSRKNTTLSFGGALFRCIRIRRKKGSHSKNFWLIVQGMYRTCSTI